jgi:hypothetical protein
MAVYSIDLKVAATAYVKADTKEQAIAALKEEIGKHGTDFSDFEISGLPLDSEDLPDISLSPAMTVWGPWGEWFDMDEA